jgi:hypothetical protein
MIRNEFNLSGTQGIVYSGREDKYPRIDVSHASLCLSKPFPDGAEHIDLIDSGVTKNYRAEMVWFSYRLGI